MLEKVKPTLTVVELGTNDLTVTNFTQKLENIKKMIIDINESGSECAWIGAPDVRFATQEVQNQYNSKLEELVNQNDCFFINS